MRSIIWGFDALARGVAYTANWLLTGAVVLVLLALLAVVGVVFAAFIAVLFVAATIAVCYGIVEEIAEGMQRRGAVGYWAHVRRDIKHGYTKGRRLL